jgi:ElaB/YqjD/DUF883 family membrane-anchored ribosome-binding protein
MYENSGTGTGDGGGVGARATAGAERVKDHIRSARDTATEAVNEYTRGAQNWSREQFTRLQDRVEAEPYRAAAWALGIGFVVGVLITALSSTATRR